jgi:hypothetical protein
MPSSFQGPSSDAAPLLDGDATVTKDIYNLGVDSLLSSIAPRGYFARPWVALEIAAPDRRAPADKRAQRGRRDGVL